MGKQKTPLLRQRRTSRRGLRGIVLALFLCEEVPEVHANRCNEGGGEAEPGELFGGGVGDDDARPSVEEIGKVVVG